MDRCHLYHQNDVEERNQQILLMSEIYSKAGRAVIWLGKEEETTAEGFATLERLNKKIVDAQGRWSLRFDLNESDLELEEALNGNLERSWPLRDILKRPWFTRMWILQEISIAHDALMLCGKHTIPWSTFDRASSYLGVAPRQDLDLDMTFVQTMKVIYGSRYEGLVLRNRSKSLPLLDVLFLTSQHGDSTDPRDKVYSLLSLVAEGLYKELRPDYSSSVRDVYITTARTIISSSGSLQILSFPEDNLPGTGLPSWVPDWRRRGSGDKRSPFGYRTGNRRYFSAAGEPRVMISADDDPSQLCIIGMVLAVIDKIWEITDVLALFKGAFKGDLSLSILCTEINPEQQFYPFTGEKIEDAYFRALTADQWYNSERIDHDYRRLYFPLVHSILQQASEEALDLPEPFWVDIGISFIKHVERIMIGRKVFLTSEGMLGLCSKGAKEGDQICILLGADVPMILRPEGDNFRLVGESYVHGMMDGEALRKWRAEMVPLKKFTIT